METDKYQKYRKKIGKGQIIGNRGETFVSFLLSQFCLVRPVASGTDVGIDLYCEALIKGIPHSHFWVQVKTRQKKIAGKMNFRSTDLEYWSRQPIPVYVFFVSEQQMTFDNFRINVINLTEHFIKEPFINPTLARGRTIQSDRTITNRNELESFVFNHVPETISRMFIRDGVIFPIKDSVHDRYLKRYKTIGMHTFSRATMKHIGRTAALFLYEILQRPREEFVDYKQQLVKILESYHKWKSWDLHYVLARAKHLDGNCNEAIKHYKRAKRAINRDEKFGILYIDMIDAYIKNCISRSTPGSQG